MALFSMILWLAHAASAQVISYQFNDSGTTSANSISSSYSIAMTDFTTSTPTDYHGAAGSGVSGNAGDLALDMTSAPSMGGSSGAVIKIANGGAVFNNATSFTISGWYKASSTPGSYARFLQVSSILLYFDGAGLTFQTGGGSDSITSKAAVGGNILSVSGTQPNYQTVNQWTFMAVTYSYNSSLSQTTVTFYVGDTSTSSSLTSYTVVYTPTVTSITGLSTTTLVMGSSGGTRFFDGLMDNINIYSSTSSSSGALDAATLNALRVAQIPEPKTKVALMIGLGGVAFWYLQRKSFRSLFFVSKFKG